MTGYWIDETKIKENATPIDNITKFAWDDDDYETVRTWVPYTATELIEREVAELKANLAATDYIACKIAEGAATVEDYAVEIAQRQTWRDRINELEN